MTIDQNIQISKARVFDEVAKKTAYIGKKATSEQDPGAYERVAVVDANREQLDTFWMEACSGASQVLDHWLSSQTSQVLSHHPEIDTSHDYKVTLSLPSNWSFAYLSTLQEVLMSYLVNSIVAAWLLITLPTQAAAYATLADGAEKQLQQLMLIRKRPVKRSSNSSGDGPAWVRSNAWIRSEAWIID